jgi:hypothetical protein
MERTPCRVPCGKWSVRSTAAPRVLAAPVLLLNGHSRQTKYTERAGEANTDSLLILTNDEHCPVNVSDVRMQFVHMSSSDMSLMEQTAALTCPVAFGWHPLHVDRLTLNRVQSATYLDPLALHAAKMYYIHLKLGLRYADRSVHTVEKHDFAYGRDRIESHKLILLDAFSGTQLFRKQSMLHQQQVISELDSILTIPDVTGASVRAFQKHVVQMSNVTNVPFTMTQILESVQTCAWHNKKKFFIFFFWQICNMDIRLTALSTETFCHLVNWGFLSVMRGFGQYPLSDLHAQACQVPFPEYAFKAGFPSKPIHDLVL